MLLAGLWTASAQALWLQPIGPNFEEPIFVTSAPNNPDRLFVVERPGRIIEVENGAPTVFADLSSLVSEEAGSEGGLLSIAISPDFQTSGRLYAYYTGKEESPAEIHIAELVASGGTASLARNLLTISHPAHQNHYGGQLQIGPEGGLFAGTGDGGGENDAEENAQDPSSLLGKLLRIDPAALPTTQVWSLGLRNPFRFSFDRQTGDLLIGDVGQKEREEVDFAAAPGLGNGANYGWNCREGFLVESVPPESGCAGAGSFTDPIFDYPHDDPGNGGAFGCAIIGGYVVRAATYGDLSGRYLYGDLCTGGLRSLVPAALSASGDREEGVIVAALNSFGEDSCGRVYAVSGNGPVFRLVGPGGPDCPVPSQANSQPAALKASFVGVRALRSKVKRNKRAFVTAFVSPCAGRRGQPVSLWQGRHKLGSRRLDRVCTVRFRPRVRHRVAFRAKVLSDGTYTEATSRRLKIRILRRHRH